MWRSLIRIFGFQAASVESAAAQPQRVAAFSSKSCFLFRRPASITSTAAEREGQRSAAAAAAAAPKDVRAGRSCKLRRLAGPAASGARRRRRAAAAHAAAAAPPPPPPLPSSPPPARADTASTRLPTKPSHCHRAKPAPRPRKMGHLRRPPRSPGRSRRQDTDSAGNRQPGAWLATVVKFARLGTCPMSCASVAFAPCVVAGLICTPACAGFGPPRANAPAGAVATLANRMRSPRLDTAPWRDACGWLNASVKSGWGLPSVGLEDGPVGVFVFICASSAAGVPVPDRSLPCSPRNESTTRPRVVASRAGTLGWWRAAAAGRSAGCSPQSGAAEPSHSRKAARIRGRAPARKESCISSIFGSLLASRQSLSYVPRFRLFPYYLHFLAIACGGKGVRHVVGFGFVFGGLVGCAAAPAAVVRRVPYGTGLCWAFARRRHAARVFLGRCFRCSAHVRPPGRTADNSGGRDVCPGLAYPTRNSK
ncbi:hypothetical protein PLESTB_001113300 [Pleodorina starrii]|uniref:Uncharacterized protein n=1 Tax=Pleodorina starrii TaxID=330485 RepID=A0A9W6BR16_9CHLO|nr:hypothetical protein PLESTB_001113300 [Pleodorina starrii]